MEHLSKTGKVRYFIVLIYPIQWTIANQVGADICEMPTVFQ